MELAEAVWREKEVEGWSSLMVSYSVCSQSGDI